MVLAAPELVIAERVELLDEIEVAAELQQRVLADRVVRGEEGTELEARHGCFLRNFLLLDFGSKVRGGRAQGNRASAGSDAWSPCEACVMPRGGTGEIAAQHKIAVVLRTQGGPVTTRRSSCNVLEPRPSPNHSLWLWVA